MKKLTGTWLQLAMTLSVSILSLVNPVHAEGQLPSYSAFEDESSVKAPEQLPLPPTGAPLASQAAQPSQASPQKTRLPRQLAAAKFEKVQSMEQRMLIAQRLEIIRDLMIKHGRAYDYRTLTISELEMIRSSLE